MQKSILACSQSIAAKNDSIRAQLPYFPKPHRLMLSQIVSNLSCAQLESILILVKNFNVFETNNDPYSEHDFGIIQHQSEIYFWKIDYYDSMFEYFQEDGHRVLTIMHESEY